ncbi:MAG: hypothetical protein DMG35_16005 [Acidobacteria bacterium]|nr:MAG: hypothetical protein AUH86_14665 [Acidobacteria bacterium 13_1_40CM_4_58_4]PYT58918.1 MAG: hypothetical protein DMG35_16005 [Acidobacteriota bacterium]
MRRRRITGQVAKTICFWKLELAGRKKGEMTGGAGFAQGCTEFHKETGRNRLPNANGKSTLTPG